MNETNHLKALKQLDDILNYISSNGNSISKHQRDFFEEPSGTYRHKPHPNDPYNMSYSFLVKEGFLIYEEHSDEYKLTYKGLLSLGPNSFVDTYKQDKRKLKANIWFWRLTPLFSAIAAVASSIILIGKICEWW